MLAVVETALYSTFCPNHPARSKSDTYYADDNNILRTHDTVMWYYYMNLPEIKEKIKKRRRARSYVLR
jgi:phenylalanyl-tRNA synthetase alpha subunit